MKKSILTTEVNLGLLTSDEAIALTRINMHQFYNIMYPIAKDGYKYRMCFDFFAGNQEENHWGTSIYDVDDVFTDEKQMNFFTKNKNLSIRMCPKVFFEGFGRIDLKKRDLFYGEVRVLANGGNISLLPMELLKKNEKGVVWNFEQYGYDTSIIAKEKLLSFISEIIEIQSMKKANQYTKETQRSYKFAVPFCTGRGM